MVQYKVKTLVMNYTYTAIHVTHRVPLSFTNYSRRLYEAVMTYFHQKCGQSQNHVWLLQQRHQQQVLHQDLQTQTHQPMSTLHASLSMKNIPRHQKTLKNAGHLSRHFRIRLLVQISWSSKYN